MQVLFAITILLWVGACSALRLIQGSAGASLKKALTATLSSLALLNAPIALVLHEGDVPRSLFVQPAHADVRAQQKRTFFRNAPKLSEGGAFLKTNVRGAIDKEDWKVIEKLFEEYVSKYNGSQKDQVDQTDTYVNANFLRPMTLLAGSFAERGSSPKQRSLMEQREIFVEAIDKLEGCVKDKKEPGFFGKTVQATKSKAQANDAYAKAKAAYNEYVTQLNTGLMLELAPLQTI